MEKPQFVWLSPPRTVDSATSWRIRHQDVRGLRRGRWHSVCSNRRWSELLSSRRCLHDHFRRTLDDVGVHLPKRLITAVVQEVTKFESSRQVHNYVCCTMTTDCKSNTQHVFALSIDTCYPVIQEAHTHINDSILKKNRCGIGLLTKRKKQNIPWSHVCMWSLDILSDPRGMIDSLRRRRAHRLIIAASKKFHCNACEEIERRRLRLVSVRVLHEPGRYL